MGITQDCDQYLVIVLLIKAMKAIMKIWRKMDCNSVRYCIFTMEKLTQVEMTRITNRLEMVKMNKGRENNRRNVLNSHKWLNVFGIKPL